MQGERRAGIVGEVSLSKVKRLSYLVLARKYRPSVFGSVSGQEHVTRTLANALKRGRVVHAYLFTGPRGVGKTSIARILSKAINCQNPKDAEPCLECDTCKEIGTGTSLAVREIDGASHNSVENVRELMDSFKSLPPPGYKRKVYIIDEVHMLSISAFNALLKSLEEPPPHTVFILATTDVHKIPETVISRCQRHDFRALSMSTIEARLKEVCEAEKITVDTESLQLVARMADGSMRDAQTLLDRVQSFCEGAITAIETSKALGTVDRRFLVEVAQAILARDSAAVLTRTSEIFSTGMEPATLLREFVHFWREVFVGKLGGEQQLKGLGLSKDAVIEVLRLVAPFEQSDIQDLWDLARDGADRALRSAQPRYGFEALVVRMATRLPVAEIGSIIGQIASTPVEKAPVQNNARATPSSSSAAPRQATQVQDTKRVEVAPTTPVAVAGGLVWEELISSIGGSAGRMLIENLKRLRPVRCEPGIFEGTGPEFTATSLMREKDKLADLFNSFLEKKGIEKPRAWKIVITKGQGAFETPSAAGGARGAGSDSSDVHEHPALQTLQKIFPGSKVEQVRVKE